MINISFYIFVTADTDPLRIAKPSAYETALYRLNRKEWNLNAKTPHRNQIKPGDQALIYISGQRENRQTIIASSVISTSAKMTPQEVRDNIDAPKASGIMTNEYSIGVPTYREGS